VIDHSDLPISKHPSNTSNPNGVTVTKNQQKTFAQALSNVCDVPLSQLPQPIKKGNRVDIKKGSPFSLEKLRAKLTVMWKSLGQWGVSSIGRGFYEFTFSSIEDLIRVRSWSLNFGFLKLFA